MHVSHLDVQIVRIICETGFGNTMPYTGGNEVKNGKNRKYG